MGQPGFFDLGERYRGLDAKKDPLVVLNAVVPWEDFRARLSAVWRKPEEERKTAAGRKPWDEIVIFKTLVLQALYNLSDDQVETQIRDRLSFMRFLGLGLADRGPDATTVWLYREKLAQAGLVEALFDAFDAHLKVLVHLEHGHAVLAEHGLELLVRHDLTLVLRVLELVLFDVVPHFAHHLSAGQRLGAHHRSKLFRRLQGLHQRRVDPLAGCTLALTGRLA